MLWFYFTCTSDFSKTIGKKKKKKRIREKQGDKNLFVGSFPVYHKMITLQVGRQGPVVIRKMCLQLEQLSGSC